MERPRFLDSKDIFRLTSALTLVVTGCIQVSKPSASEIFGNELQTHEATSPPLPRFSSASTPDSRSNCGTTLPTGLVDYADGLFIGESRIVGVWSQDNFEFPTEVQPTGNPLFVTRDPEEVSIFQRPIDSETQVIGLLAHNTLAGKDFKNIKIGETVYVIRGDGMVAEYTITKIKTYQKLKEGLVDLASGNKLTQQEVYDRMYGGEHHIVLQTCLTRGGNTSWGLVFYSGQLKNEETICR